MMIARRASMVVIWLMSMSRCSRMRSRKGMRGMSVEKS